MALTRNTKIGIGAAAIVALPLAAWLAFGYFGIHKLWVDDEVDEELTEFVVADDTTSTTDPVDTTGSSDGPAATTAPTAPPDTVPAAPVLVRSGAFSGVEGHRVEGQVNLIRTPEGSLILQLPDLDAENGPDLVLWLSQAGDTDEVIDLGALKGNIGNQEYVLPDGVTEASFDTVLIWCRRFSVGFGEATVS